MQASIKTIPQIFNNFEMLEIPFFQRAYVWGELQWERFLEDMETISATCSPYFLGSIIIKQENATIGSSVRTVIDGQQRLTTLQIFFKVLGLLIKNNEISNTRWRLSKDGSLALKHSANDVQQFEHIMGLKTLESVSTIDNISKAYTYFKDNIDASKLNPYDMLEKIMFVCIEVAPNEDEQQIFDTINSLGIKLTTSELLKNYFFHHDIAAYNQYWRNIFEIDSDTKGYWEQKIMFGHNERIMLDIFFYAYLQIKISEIKVSNEDRLLYSKVDNLFESYKSFIKKYNIEKKDILSEIQKYALEFHKTFRPNITTEPIPHTAGIKRINELIFGLDNSTLIPYTLFIIHNQQDLKVQNCLFSAIETYIVRRYIVRANQKNYNQLFSTRCIQSKCLTDEDFITLIASIDDKVNSMPTDDEIRSFILDEQHKYTNKVATNILYLIETKHDKTKCAMSMLGLDKYSLEHLMPQKWSNHWEIPQTPDEIEAIERAIYNIGNLTIIPNKLNSAIKDADWYTKKNGKGDKGGLSKYASGIEILEPYLQNDIWNINTIYQRSKDLYQLIVKFWSTNEKFGLIQQEIKKSHKFSFTNCGIEIGEEIVFTPTKITVRSVSNKEVEYNGEKYSLSGFVKKFLPIEKRTPSGAYQGPKYFTYKGKKLTDLY